MAFQLPPTLSLFVTLHQFATLLQKRDPRTFSGLPCVVSLQEVKEYHSHVVIPSFTLEPEVMIDLVNFDW